MTVGGSLRALGVGGSLSYAAGRLAGGTAALGYHRYAIVAVPVTGMPRMPRGHAVREISEAELKSFEIDAAPGVRQMRFAQGLSCIGAFAGDELVGVNWLKRGEYDEDEVHVRFLLPEDAAWDTGLWIRPDRRLGRAFAALWAGTAAWLSTRGLDRSISRIADYNLASLNSHRRMGALVLDSMTVLRAGDWQMATAVRPRLTNIRRDSPAILDLRRGR